MPIIKPRHLFIGMMGFSVVNAFALPRRYAITSLPSIEILFAPVARPTRAIAFWAHDKFAHEIPTGLLAAEELNRENQALRNELASVSAQLEELKRVNNERNKIDIRAYCTPFTVIGGDSGLRQTLAIQGSSLQGLREKMYVVYSGGIVGQVQRAGPAGARVQLITDIGFRVRAAFVRFDGIHPHNIDIPQALAEGTGRGTMRIALVTAEAVNKSGLKIGDTVVVNEPEWPPYLQGRHLGRVSALGVRIDAPRFAEITVEPQQRLTELREVMIVTKPPEAGE